MSDGHFKELNKVGAINVRPHVDVFLPKGPVESANAELPLNKRESSIGGAASRRSQRGARICMPKTIPA